MNKILLIDDNETQHELFRCYALGTDFQFEHAFSLEQAVEWLDESSPDAAPDCVFLDNRLAPYNDFRETIPALREAGFDGKIVVISSDVKHPLFQRAGEYSVHTYLNKFEFNLSNFAEIADSLVSQPGEYALAAS